MNLPEFTWIYMNLHDLPEFTWIFLKLHECTWIYFNLLEFTWIYLNSTEFNIIYQNLPEITWTYLNLPELTWTYLYNHIGGFVNIHTYIHTNIRTFFLYLEILSDLIITSSSFLRGSKRNGIFLPITQSIFLPWEQGRNSSWTFQWKRHVLLVFFFFFK